MLCYLSAWTFASLRRKPTQAARDSSDSYDGEIRIQRVGKPLYNERLMLVMCCKDYCCVGLGEQ